MREEDIRRAIRERMGIERLNEMQLAMAHTDDELTILLAPTGSGKTLAFLIAALRHMSAPCGRVQTVVIAPSRELVIQIEEVVRRLSTGYKVVACYGGHNMADEANSLATTPDIIIATPGRLLDHARRGNLPKGIRLHTLVLDEYDKMLSLGFADEMNRLLRFFAPAEHVILTSATPLDEETEATSPLAFLRSRCKQPLTLDFTPAESETKHPNITVYKAVSPEKDKVKALAGLLKEVAATGARSVIVFANHRESAERIHAHLHKLHLPVGLYHGGLEQWDREKAIELLNNGTTPILISTDLASRGLDIDTVDAVVHYHKPPNESTWVHRNGRTGRQDAAGTVYILASEGEDWAPFDADARDLANSEIPGQPSRLRHPTTSSIYFAAGRKEKISRGDIVGFLLANTTLQPTDIGRIALKDHAAIVAIPAARAAEVIEGVANKKIKNKKVRVSLIKN